MSGTPAIEVQGISKTFRRPDGGAIEALKQVRFTVPRGQVFAILGPNGAGKTTLLRILTTVSRPDAGTALIEGYDLLKQSVDVRQQIGIVAQGNYFDKYLTVWHNLTLHAQMHGISRPVYEARISDLLKRVNLYDRRFDYADQLSGGMQRRVVLIRALIHQPKVLFLDEPTTGLDPEARREIWEIIEEFKQQATVILTTHYMEEADTLSDQILILNRGQVVRTGTATELKNLVSSAHRFDIWLKVPEATRYAQLLEGANFRQVEKLSEDRLRITLSNADELPRVLTVIPADALMQLAVAEANLETVYLAMATDKAQDKAAMEGRF